MSASLICQQACCFLPKYLVVSVRSQYLILSYHPQDLPYVQIFVILARVSRCVGDFQSHAYIPKTKDSNQIASTKQLNTDAKLLMTYTNPTKSTQQTTYSFSNYILRHLASQVSHLAIVQFRALIEIPFLFLKK